MGEDEDLRAEVGRLRRWKSEATEVILGLQDLGKALGIPLGERITGETAAEAARTLRAEVEHLRPLQDSVNRLIENAHMVAAGGMRHAWFCDCGTCEGDGFEAQWHRRGCAHWCGGVWWEGFGPLRQDEPPFRPAPLADPAVSTDG